MLTTVALVAIVTLMNIGGVRVSGRLQLILAAVLVTMLVIAVATALPHARTANLHPFAPHGWWAIAPAAAVLVWGFAGWEAVTSLAADFRHPSRDLPRATGIAIAVVAVLYLAIAATSFLVLGPKTGSTDAPLSELLAIGIGGPVRVITAIVARPSSVPRSAGTARCPPGSPTAARSARSPGAACWSSPPCPCSACYWWR
jgi:amino acid efflux transporter